MLAAVLRQSETRIPPIGCAGCLSLLQAFFRQLSLSSLFRFATWETSFPLVKCLIASVLAASLPCHSSAIPHIAKGQTCFNVYSRFQLCRGHHKRQIDKCQFFFNL